MNKFYATFGISQPNEGYIVEIHADTWDDAHRKMFDRFGRVWGFMYEKYEDLDERDRRNGILQVLT